MKKEIKRFIHEMKCFLGDVSSCNEFIYAYASGDSNNNLKRKLDYVLDDISKQDNNHLLLSATYDLLIELQKKGK